MFKGTRLIGIILTILLVVSINGFTAYYKYTQESGANFYVGAGDKADALEDTNEVRQILDDLGNLLGHTKRDDLYPKDGTAGGTIQIPEAGLKFGNDPANGDIAAYIAGEMAWQTKSELGIDLSLYYLKTQIDTLSEVEAIYTKDITDSTELAAALGAYYLKTAIDSQGEMETIWEVTLATDAELTALKFIDLSDTPATYDNGKYAKSTADGVVWDDPAGGASTYLELTDTPADYTSGSLKFVRVNVGETALEFAAEADPTVDTDAEIKAILVDEVTKTGDFTAGRIAKINNATGIIEQGTNTDTEVADAVTKKHSQNIDTDLDATFEATFVKKIDTVNVLSDITSTGANIEDAVTKRHSKNADTALGTLTADVNMGTHKLTGLSVPSATGQSVRTTATITEANLEDAISKKHSQNTDTDLDATFEATFVKKTDTVNVLSDITSAGADIEDAVTKKHTQNTDTQFDFYNALAADHTWSGDKDTQPVGEAVIFGDLLYPDWTAGEWLKADANYVGMMPGLRIALESKTDGQACLMLVKGYIRDDSAFEFTASMVYTSTVKGMVTSTAPFTAGDQLQRVGMAKSADILFFDPSIDVGEI